MAKKSSPITLKILSANPINQWNKQAVKAIHPNGATFNLVLTDKSGKLPVGQINADHEIEIWEYQQKWYGKLTATQPAAPQAPQGPQGPPEAAGEPNASTDDNGSKEMRIVRGNALNAVLSAVRINANDVDSHLVAGVTWILTGKWDLFASTPSEVSGQQEEDDIPC